MASLERFFHLPVRYLAPCYIIAAESGAIWLHRRLHWAVHVAERNCFQAPRIKPRKEKKKKKVNGAFCFVFFFKSVPR